MGESPRVEECSVLGEGGGREKEQKSKGQNHGGGGGGGDKGQQREVGVGQNVHLVPPVHVKIFRLVEPNLSIEIN